MVSCSTDEDGDKVRRLLHYLPGKINLSRIIGSNSLDVLQTWVGSAYAAHYDMRTYGKIHDDGAGGNIW